jgi:hypothetical protein
MTTAMADTVTAVMARQNARKRPFAKEEPDRRVQLRKHAKPSLAIVGCRGLLATESAPSAPDTNSPANNAYYRAASCRYCINPTWREKDSSRRILLAIASIVLIHSDFESILRWICDERGSSDHGHVRSGMIIVTAWNNADLRLRDLWVLSVVLREHNLTRAAELLDTTQPSISKILARLREHFGHPLFIRNGNVMHPTPLGA